MVVRGKPVGNTARGSVHARPRSPCGIAGAVQASMCGVHTTKVGRPVSSAVDILTSSAFVIVIHAVVFVPRGTRFQRTPLRWASWKGHVHVAKVLQEHGAVVDAFYSDIKCDDVRGGEGVDTTFPLRI